jgi:benzoyl-CoA 2,3-dioxygenase component B
MQLHSLAQSGFDPLSRTCRFMLTEEAHHMFVGETGVSRVIQRTAEAMKAAGIDDPYDIGRVRALGVIDLPTIQKKANLHFSLTLDLFGNEISTNAANAFNAGLKGRYREDKLTDDHLLTSSIYPVLRPRDGAIVNEDVAALSALNMRLRDDYVEDAAAGVTRWNRVLERIGTAFRITLPHVAFNRRIGEFSAIHTDTAGKILSDEAWQAYRESALPSIEDNLFISSLMRPSVQPGVYADWIAAPRQGVDNMPGDFEYVRLAS